MARPQENPAITLPRWLIILASAGIAFHLFALVVLVIAAPSGPWPTSFGPSPDMPPMFAQEIIEFPRPKARPEPGERYSSALRSYLEALHMTHNYHFSSNRTD